MKVQQIYPGSHPVDSQFSRDEGLAILVAERVERATRCSQQQLYCYVHCRDLQLRQGLYIAAAYDNPPVHFEQVSNQKYSEGSTLKGPLGIGAIAMIAYLERFDANALRQCLVS